MQGTALSRGTTSCFHVVHFTEFRSCSDLVIQDVHMSLVFAFTNIIFSQSSPPDGISLSEINPIHDKNMLFVTRQSSIPLSRLGCSIG